MTDDSLVSWRKALDPLPGRLERELPKRWSGFEFLPSVDSTNRQLLDCQALVHDAYRVCVAREQTAGKGRRGRTWVSAGGSSLTFSLARALRPGEAPAPALALAIGVGVSRGLSRCGLHGFGFKWPNDLVTPEGRKLAGILIEARPRTGGCRPAVVAGVGVNRRDAVALGVDRPTADLGDLSASSVPGLTDLLQAILVEIARAWDAFARDGLQPVLEDYRRLDHLFGRPVRVTESGREGIAAGVDPVDGALLLQGPGGLERLYSGDVSVRRVDRA
ncbi:biotin--[acetyl-CoA-carboxylase] ligase [Thioalkalivibrio sp.]|uniref:biotin--[acetyl-CoA-carboxylase] ligase n=1 Tax=Thioalkalivibrio sp. TaxID=2093813 RepID=UPI003562AE92